MIAGHGLKEHVPKGVWSSPGPSCSLRAGPGAREVSVLGVRLAARPLDRPARLAQLAAEMEVDREALVQPPLSIPGFQASRTPAKTSQGEPSVIIRADADHVVETVG